MAFTEWAMQGVEFLNCNCDLGCPCQFNALPTDGHCRAVCIVQIDSGHFGDVPLDGLRWGVFAAWPGAIHHGNGTFQVVIDDRADARQRAAIEAVALGRETDPGTLIWQVFSTTVTQILPTLVSPIDFTFDMQARKARVSLPGLVEATAQPIRNPVTGAPHRAQVTLPEGFEYTTAEYASGSAQAHGSIPMDFDGTHAHLAQIHWSTHGVVRH